MQFYNVILLNKIQLVQCFIKAPLNAENESHGKKWLYLHVLPFN